jgi:hypothetical protein
MSPMGPGCGPMGGRAHRQAAGRAGWSGESGVWSGGKGRRAGGSDWQGLASWKHSSSSRIGLGKGNLYQHDGICCPKIVLSPMR